MPLFAGLLLAIIWLPSTPAAAAESAPLPKILRLTSGTWEPWSSPDLPEGGIATRVVRDAFATQGITVEIGWFPWPRAWDLAQREPWDASFAWVIDDARKTAVLFSDPVYIGTTVFMHRRGEPLVWDRIDDLADKRIGVTLGYSYGPDFAAAVASGKISTDPAPSDEANLRKLLGHRIDLFPIDDIVGMALVRRILGAKATDLAFDPRPVYRSTNHLVVRKDHPHAAAILAAFNAGLAMVKDRDDPARWLERWGHQP